MKIRGLTQNKGDLAGMHTHVLSASLLDEMGYLQQC